MEEREEQIMCCITYSILYANDIACNEVLALGYKSHEMDKESKKIYGALAKRAKNYIRTINEIVGENSWFFSDFCSQMDEIFDPVHEKFNEVVKKVFREDVGGNHELLATIEIARTLVHISANHFRFAKNTAIHYSKQARLLDNCMLGGINEMPRIVDNLAKWAHRGIDKSIDLNSYPELVSATNELIDTFKSLKDVCESYQIAIKNT